MNEREMKGTRAKLKYTRERQPQTRKARLPLLPRSVRFLIGSWGLARKGQSTPIQQLGHIELAEDTKSSYSKLMQIANPVGRGPPTLMCREKLRIGSTTNLLYHIQTLLRLQDILVSGKPRVSIKTIHIKSNQRNFLQVLRALS